MLFLFTGTPGASKTLNAIKFVNEDPLFAINDATGKPTNARRPVYYFNMRDVKLPWTELTLEEAMCWFNLPDGAVIIFDEAYDVFPQRLRGEAPEQVKRLATHRHKGFDIIIICQKVTGQVDSFVRGLIGRHVHLERRFGTNMVTRLEWQKCCENVNDYHAKKEAISKNIKIDKKYFGAYHSAEVHTIKSNIPWLKVLAIPALLVVAVSLIWFGVSSLTSDKSVPVAETVVSTASAMNPFGNNSGVSKKGSATTAEYFESFTPRIAGLPHTAPIYDDVTKPVTYPKLSCMGWVKTGGVQDCKCLTQQGTSVKVPRDTCLNIAKNGLFDPAKEDREQIDERRFRDEMQTRVAMQTAVDSGLEPSELVRATVNNSSLIGTVRPYDHFFEGTGKERGSSSSSNSSNSASPSSVPTSSLNAQRRQNNKISG
jgi:zona occludens toxin